MAVKAVTTASTQPLQYIGLSTDAKPLDAPTGAIFYELDTTDMYIFDGDETWWVM